MAISFPPRAPLFSFPLPAKANRPEKYEAPKETESILNAWRTFGPRSTNIYVSPRVTRSAQRSAGLSNFFSPMKGIPTCACGGKTTEVTGNKQETNRDGTSREKGDVGGEGKGLSRGVRPRDPSTSPGGVIGLFAKATHPFLPASSFDCAETAMCRLPRNSSALPDPLVYCVERQRGELEFPRWERDLEELERDAGNVTTPPVVWFSA